ncbi:MAG: HlyD family secretion protein [Flammeovirgaceae bacterium]
MKIVWKLLLSISMFIGFTSCETDERTFDATGAFEAEETIISSKVSGTIMDFQVEEGQELKANTYIGYIDTTQLHLSKKMLAAQIEAVLSKRPDIAAQLSKLEAQLKAAQKEKVRISNLLNEDAATAKQLDDINAEIKILQGGLRANKSSLSVSTSSLGKEVEPLKVQIEQIEDQLAKSRLINPLNGTILMKYARQHEQVSTGMPLYKIADLSWLTLRAYITGDQLPKAKLGQKLKVFTDDGNGGFHEALGTIYWISDKAEFTPKTIQTKNERANKVYAIKIRVPNENSLYKIGMYGEVNF